jgi:hypothetical protein
MNTTDKALYDLLDDCFWITAYFVADQIRAYGIGYDIMPWSDYMDELNEMMADICNTNLLVCMLQGI